MEFIMNNWPALLGIAAFAVSISCAVLTFLNRPRAEQIDNVREWLLWAVNQAEIELGSGTGALKLRMVYDMFITRFPAVARFVGFDTFSGWVDEALDYVENMLMVHSDGKTTPPCQPAADSSPSRGEPEKGGEGKC